MVLKQLLTDSSAIGSTLPSGQAVKNNAWIWENGKKKNKIIWKERPDISECFC